MPSSGGGSHPKLNGHAHVVYADDANVPPQPAKPAGQIDSYDARTLIDALHASNTKALVIPHHTNAREDHNMDFEDQAREMFGDYLDHAKTLRIEDAGWGPWTWWTPDDEYLRLFEICQLRGSFELDRREEGVLMSDYAASAQDALAKGLRWGFVGGTDTHEGRPGDRDAIYCLGPKRRGGMTAVLAEKLTREAIFEALRARRCYATTFARIIVDFAINGSPMGSELTLQRGQSVQAAITVNGSAPLAKVELIKNNTLAKSWHPPTEDLTTTWTDTPTAPSWYYLRITQHDGEMAWSSPIWIDL